MGERRLFHAVLFRASRNDGLGRGDFIGNVRKRLLIDDAVFFIERHLIVLRNELRCKGRPLMGERP